MNPFTKSKTVIKLWIPPRGPIGTPQSSIKRRLPRPPKALLTRRITDLSVGGALAGTTLVITPKKRVPQTASLRKRQSERLARDVASSSMVSSIEPNAVEEDVRERDIGREDVNSKIDENSLKGPFPGGPQTNELLVDYRHHITYHIWNGKGDRSLQCH
ncbi:hypothetical protein QJS10_CPA01g01827 [Acorus calamus]|uniref:Uncharacterized protein n=1 Tax=Acorus calamus TaxID=4465 RepID=A0AAV9FLR2_ACOCL|nr:hypothetical protein QJS10_CPA01g01827 [Acorus calamus]